MHIASTLLPPDCFASPTCALLRFAEEDVREQWGHWGRVVLFGKLEPSKEAMKQH